MPYRTKRKLGETFEVDGVEYTVTREKPNRAVIKVDEKEVVLHKHLPTIVDRHLVTVTNLGIVSAVLTFVAMATSL
jgi:hypothetical protein